MVTQNSHCKCGIFSQLHCETSRISHSNPTLHAQDINFRLDFAELFPRLTHLCVAGSQFGRLDFFDAIKSLAELLWVNLWGTLVAETHVQRDEQDNLVSMLSTSTMGDIQLASRINVVFEPCRLQ